MIYETLKKNPAIIFAMFAAIIMFSVVFSKMSAMTNTEKLDFTMKNSSLIMYGVSLIYAFASSYLSYNSNTESMENVDNAKDKKNDKNDEDQNDVKELLKRIKKLEKSRNTHIVFLTDCGKNIIPEKLNKHIISTDDDKRFSHKFSLIDDKDTVELVITTDGGDFGLYEQYAKMILEHCNTGKVLSYVPYKALSGGSEMVLSSSDIYMYPKALLSPTDIQIVTKDKGESVTQFSAKVIMNAFKDSCPTDTTKILNEKAKQYYEYSVSQTKQKLNKKYDEETVKNVLDKFVSGDIVHDSSYNVTDLRDMGLKINTDIDKEMRSLIDDITDFFDK